MPSIYTYVWYSLNFLSIGIRSSYSVGACRIIPAVPANTASVNIHKNSLSKTIATYFQSSFTCKKHVEDNRTEIIIVYDTSARRISVEIDWLID